MVTKLNTIVCSDCSDCSMNNANNANVKSIEPQTNAFLLPQKQKALIVLYFVILAKFVQKFVHFNIYTNNANNEQTLIFD